MYRKYLYIAIASVLTSIISLSMHVIILQYFHAPEMQISPALNLTIDVAIRFCTVIASLLIYIMSEKYWLSIKLPQRIILFAILMMALTESLFRSTIMNILVSSPWLYQILAAIPSYLKFLSLSFMICLCINQFLLNKKYLFLRILFFAILTTVITIAVSNAAKTLLGPLLMTMQSAGSNIIQPPYGLNILILAYITYLEPTIASFIVFYLIKDKLPFGTFAKGFILGCLIAAAHAGIYSLLQIFYSEGNIFYRIFYYGQFLWEYFALGILTACSYALFTKQLKAPFPST